MRLLVSILLIAVLGFSSCKIFKKSANDKPKTTKVKTEAVKPVKAKTVKIPEESELTDTHWRLSEMNGKAVASTGDDKGAYIMLYSKKSQLGGSGGCNEIMGTHKIGKHNVIAFEAAMTKMACAQGMDTEYYISKALSGANRYVINGHNLLLYNDTYLLAVFEAKYN